TRGLRMNGRDYGEFRASAEQTGSVVNVNVDSTVAESTITGKLQTQLAGDFQTSAWLGFKNVRYSNWSGLLGVRNSGGVGKIDALVEGSASGSVAVLKPKNLRGTVELSKLEIAQRPRPALTGSARTPQLVLQNAGPIEFTASESAMQVRKASLIGKSTRITVGGRIALAQAVAFDLTADGKGDLTVLHDLDPA